ncbi:TetR/AcrR family transcriptional regulator [Propionibacteriaceae bacterium Y1685]|uniref:TetR/AcrR family transcriptional regulator n=1 Tax=Microlunatus sp. Y1700 TaxID=3418487 RepID=UPI003B82954E
MARLTADDWAREALAVIGESGINGLAVEPLAKRLKTTKGSFYWHFADRAALIDAALSLWEREHTEQVITLTDRASAGADAREHLRVLLHQVMGSRTGDRIELGLLASATDPRVKSAMERVTARRVGYLATLYEGMGVAPAEAHQRAVIAISVYLGHLQLLHAGRGTLPTTKAARATHLDLIMDTLSPEPATK